ncbi:S-adenosyl-L-methionine-dependent methyltransferase [Dothidotthia symphoricarpi CBS 119687]|uniref:S-adenosyl-L-methionine-dependent methyltransferase n=1 Tax=Dothidotthia symphoricarpi CBS 119687 TaxID=1392245 RepID=A0A6A5ZXS6_9PLEO|nr:S-adenosyl-L-methionine-dependent methyltransferase [Dothidotthia symphoricarpi CBS 119687]KAF2124339.1 S-adenosyl-L-methionine-dependent methyltransferase [Dothidotthia symphoricarpi CBS 119687]
MTDTTTAYQALTKHLAKAGYHFVCPSPETQARVVQKRSLAAYKYANNGEEFFGWNLPCARQTLGLMIPDVIFESLLKASIIETSDNVHYRSKVRISNFYLPAVPSLDLDLGAAPLYYVHSAFPASSDSVFFGPDTYLFIAFLRGMTRHLLDPPKSIIDVCCGSGAGAIHMARTYPHAQTYGMDLNPRALRLGSVNASLAGVSVDFQESNLYAAVSHRLKSSGVDLIVSNPPYIASSSDGEDLPIYADGGAACGLDISRRIVEEGMEILSPSGILVLYTGVAIAASCPGYDTFLATLKSMDNVDIVEYTVLHPDMWSEEIGQGAYADIGRIQVVGAVLRAKR